MTGVSTSPMPTSSAKSIVYGRSTIPEMDNSQLFTSTDGTTMAVSMR